MIKRVTKSLLVAGIILAAGRLFGSLGLVRFHEFLLGVLLFYGVEMHQMISDLWTERCSKSRE